MSDVIGDWLSGQASSGIWSALASLVIIALAVRSIHVLVRLSATVVLWSVVVVASAVAYGVTYWAGGSNGQVLAIAVVMGVLAGIFTVPLLPFLVTPGRVGNAFQIPLVDTLWSKVAGAERRIARIDNQWTNPLSNKDRGAAAQRGIEALDDVERRYTLSNGERIWLTNLRQVMRGYLPKGPAN